MDRSDRPPLQLRYEDAIAVGYANDLYELLRATGNGDIRLSRSLSPEVIERVEASISESLRERE